jgi:hypothetical protein
MQYGHVHASLQHIHPCHVDMDMQFRRELRHAASTCPCYFTIPKLHVHVHAECPSLYFFRVHAASPYPCCMSMSMLLFHVDTSCPCPCCIFMSILHIHVNSAYPNPCSKFCPCSKFMSILHVHDHAVCLCPCVMSKLMPHVHANAVCLYPCQRRTWT